MTTTTKAPYSHPPLIRAGDPRVKLGYFSQEPKVDCYVVAADNLHKLERQHDSLLECLTRLRASISTHGGCGNPSCPDRVEAYLAIGETDALLAAVTPVSLN